MQLGESEALGMLHHHHRRLRHVDADLDHRGGDQDVEIAGRERGHGGIALRRLLLAVDQPDTIAEGLAACGAARSRRRGRLLRIHPPGGKPTDAGAVRNRALEAVGDLVQALERNGASVDRLPARRFLGQLRHVDIAVGGHHQCAGRRWSSPGGRRRRPCRRAPCVAPRRSDAARPRWQGAGRRIPRPPAPTHACRRSASNHRTPAAPALPRAPCPCRGRSATRSLAHGFA